MTDYPPPDMSYVDVFRERSAEFTAKSEDAQSSEAKQAYLDLADMYQNMANSLAELGRQWEATNSAGPTGHARLSLLGLRGVKGLPSIVGR